MVNWPSAVACTALLAAALSLQGCDSSLAFSAFYGHHKEHPRVSLMQMPPKQLEKDSDPADLDEDSEDEDAPLATDEVERIRAGLHANHDKNAPTMAQKPKGIDDVKWRAFVQMATAREKQQDELQLDYNNMLDMNDPDEVDKAMKAAWTKMDTEDRRMNAGFMQHMHKQPHQELALSQISERTTRLSARKSHRHHRRMLNRHARASEDHAASAGSTLERIERTEKEAKKALSHSEANEKQEKAMSGAMAAMMSSKHPESEASMLPAVKAIAMATKDAIHKVQDAENADF